MLTGKRPHAVQGLYNHSKDHFGPGRGDDCDLNMRWILFGVDKKLDSSPNTIDKSSGVQNSS
jgi:hypothetical protein